MSSLIAEDTEQRWVPTHVQVTVLRGRGLRGKGKHGTSDVYTIIQVGKEKYSTGVVEKTTSPEWKEECAFELQPGVLEDGGRSAYPPGSCDLTLTVMHRALIGLDVFLGQAVVPLDKAFRDNVCVKNEWYKLNSKTGKKEKERGDIQVTVTFTRNNLTASMYDLAVKDKSASTFTKLKERMKGKKRSSEEDSAADILASGYGTLVRMRNRLPSDGGGEEEYEDDEGGEARRSKMRSYFLRGKLRKSSDTRSSTSLGSESSESSSRGGSLSPTAGISVVVSDLSNSPSNSSNLTADNSPEHTADTSPKLSPLHHGGHFDDDEPSGEITLFVPQPFARLNGCHPQSTEEPGSGKPILGNSLGLLQRSMPMSISLQNLGPPKVVEELPKGPAGDGRRWSFDKAGDEEKAAIAAVLEQSGCPKLGFGDSVERLGQVESATYPPPGSSSGAVGPVSPGKKQRRNLFSHGKSESSGTGQSQSRVEPQFAPTHTEEKHHKGGWFGSKDGKPSPVVSPKLEPSTAHYSPHHPHLSSQPPSDHPWGPPVPPIDSSASPGSPFHHTNPFSHSQTCTPPMSPANPFFPLPQCNPFFGDKLANQALRSVPPPLPFLSSSRPPISELFPEHERNPNPALCHGQTSPEDPLALDKHTQRCLPPVPTEEKRFIKELSNPITSSGAEELDAEWDADFDLFTAGRLQSTGSPTTHCKPNQTVLNGPPLDHHSNKGVLLFSTDMNDALHPQNTCTETPIEATEVTSQVINSDINPVMFGHFPNANAHECMEGDNIMLAASADACAHSLDLGVCLESISNHNPNAATASNENYIPCHDCDHIHSNSSPCPSPIRKLHDKSPNPCSSGIGSSAEEDITTSLSLYSVSEKFSTSSSSEDAEFQTMDGTFHEECPEQISKEILDCSESVIPVFNKSDVLSVLCPFKNDHNKEVQPSGSEGHGLPTTTVTKELGDDETPNLPDILCPDLLPKTSMQSDHGKEIICDLKEPQGDTQRFSEDTDNTLIDNTKPNTPSIIFEDQNVATFTSFNIMTSSPCDNPFFKESPVASISLGAQHLNSCSPSRPDKPFGDFLNSSYIGTSPDQSQGFDNSLLNTGVSDQSPSSSLSCSLYMSADTEHYQSCLTHYSEASEESVGQLGAGTLPSAYSAVCGAEPCDEVGEFQSVSVADTERIAALGLEDSTNECSQCDDESNQTEGLEMLNAEKTVVFDPSFTMEEDFGFHILSNARTNSHISAVSNDHVPSDFSDPPKTECTTLQRSHSEGTMNIQSDSLHMPSFGSDPGLPLCSSSASAQPVSDLLSAPLPASSSYLTAKSSFPIALSPVPLPNASGSVRSPPSMALQTTVPALCTALPTTDAPHTVLPQETWWQPANQENSPHPVKPLTTAILVEEKRTEGRSVLEKLKSTIHPGRSAQHSEQEAESKKSLTEGAGSYYHLNHSELVALLVQREEQLQRQKTEFECQRALLAKREVELKKLKPQVRDLEDYIDTLLVRIMEQTPTLLQVGKKK